MCRNIRQLHNFAPPATEQEVRAAALQFVRKVSGSVRPSKANQAVFDAAIEQITATTAHLLEHLVAQAPPKNREAEALKAKAKWDRKPERTSARSERDKPERAPSERDKPERAPSERAKPAR